ncbi:MAG: hypothetical protein IH914_00715 [candidate division Zixibacteria bacterium]|nr:hypothetical protein [candidate division Zixibacteria bacterium]
MRWLKRLGALLALPLCLSVTQCGSLPSSDAGSGTINVGLSAGGLQNVPGVFATVTELAMDSVKLVLGRVRFVSVAGDSLDFRLDSALVVKLNLNGAVTNLGSISAPVGVYNESRFRLLKLDSLSSPIVYKNNPDVRDVSIRVDGFVDGNLDSTFSWTTDLVDELVQTGRQFTVTDGGVVNLIFNLDINGWFTDTSGGTLDPRIDATGDLKIAVENNIKTGFDVQFVP